MTMTHTRTHTFTGLTLVKPLVKAILEHPEGHEWSLQGFGMLRTYLGEDRNLRLHIWDSRFRAEGVDDIHTHPWNFHSYVVAGKVVNTRLVKIDELDFAAAERLGRNLDNNAFLEQRILCGEGGGPCGDPLAVALREHRPETIGEGDQYSQLAHEIHRSSPEDGTVTIIAREFLDDADHAFVYIPEGQEWGSAEPRPATEVEVKMFCAKALTDWF